jgi:hypothetical protein
MRLPLASIAAILLAFSAACYAKDQNMIHSDEIVKRVFAQTRDICVGRFVVTVPSTARIIYGRFDVPFLTERYPGGLARFDEIVQSHKNSIEEQKHLIDGELLQPGSRLGTTIKGDSPGQRILFNLSNMNGARYAMESFVVVGEDVFVQYGDHYASAEDVPPAIARLNQVAKRLTRRRDDELPDTPGFCIDGALVLDPAQPEVERTQFGVRFAEIPDVHFSVSMTRKSRRYQSDALEPRLIEAEQLAKETGMGDWYNRIRTLKRGSRKLPPWEGYEALARLPPHQDIQEHHHFAFVALGEPNNAYIPTIDIELLTGVSGNTRGGATPSVSDEQAIEIWERLLNSLRVRPASAK